MTIKLRSKGTISFRRGTEERFGHCCTFQVEELATRLSVAAPRAAALFPNDRVAGLVDAGAIDRMARVVRIETPARGVPDAGSA
jgi:hypothetical protein